MTTLPTTTPGTSHATVIAPAPTSGPGASGITRRRILKLAFWTSAGTLLAGAVASIVNSLYPRSVEAFGGAVAVPASRVPKPGDPPLISIEGKFWLVNLGEGEGHIAGDDSSTQGGLVALWRRCPHLGCAVPWNAGYVAPQDKEGRQGWFLCPCHGSTYTKAGVRVHGPATRSMDTMLIEVDAEGNVIVQTGQRTNGDTANPLRATQLPQT